MAYNVDHITKLGHLKMLAQRLKQDFTPLSDFEALEEKVDEMITVGGQPNVIEKIQVNGQDQEIVDKTVNISVPQKVSQLENDELFQTESEVAQAIQTAISETGHASFKVVDQVPDPAEAEQNVLYLVKNEETGYYDIYALIDGEMVLLDDTSVDLTDYVTDEDLEAAIADFIKLTDLSYVDAGSGNVVTSVVYDNETGVFTVTKAVTAILDTDLATDEEVQEMLDEVFAE